MTTILEYIRKLIRRLKMLVSRRPKLDPELDISEKTVLLYNPNILSKPANDDEDEFDMFMVENSNKKLRIKIFN